MPTSPVLRHFSFRSRQKNRNRQQNVDSSAEKLPSRHVLSSCRYSRNHDPFHICYKGWLCDRNLFWPAAAIGKRQHSDLDCCWVIVWIMLSYIIYLLMLCNIVTSLTIHQNKNELLTFYSYFKNITNMYPYTLQPCHFYDH